jgi:LmbE family N-acetylglucosaminyl deacetylase
MLDILVVVPHPDDAELGMAGTIVKFKDDGWRGDVLDLTAASLSHVAHLGPIPCCN